jgi:hypothetical protein
MDPEERPSNISSAVVLRWPPDREAAIFVTVPGTTRTVGVRIVQYVDENDPAPKGYSRRRYPAPGAVLDRAIPYREGNKLVRATRKPKRLRVPKFASRIREAVPYPCQLASSHKVY